ncbi:MAG: UDP-2,3-diacylglucosamine diphosphatase LpxI [Candidatus Gastranaerophilales bacterium]
MLENKQCIVAGDGILPIKMAQYAKENGFDVICISLAKDNVSQLKKYCSKIYSCHPGEVEKIKQIVKDEEIKQLTFLGKVHKRVLLQLHKFDATAISLLKEAHRLNDDEVMLMIVKEFESLGVTILDQTIFIKNLMIPSGVLGKAKPSEEQLKDVNYGFWLAKEMGNLDVGQSVVIKDKMIMAVEAIEGTDCCIRRGAKFAKKNSCVIKVAKPSQDKRFDIPAFGLRTLKTMKKYKASLIAVEANETIVVDQEKVVKFANENNIVIMAV